MELSFKEQQKQVKLEARKRFLNPFKVGDIVHHSWGYDQTNCDFYQVVEVLKVSVILRKIGSKTVPGSEGSMCDSQMPDKDAFVEKGHHALTKYGDNITPENSTILKRVSFYVKEDGSLRYFIPVSYGWCDLWEGKSEPRSWYA